MRPTLKTAAVLRRRKPASLDPDVSARLRIADLEAVACEIADIAILRAATAKLGDEDVAAYICRRASMQCSSMIRPRQTSQRHRAIGPKPAQAKEE